MQNKLKSIQHIHKLLKVGMDSAMIGVLRTVPHHQNCLTWQLLQTLNSAVQPPHCNLNTATFTLQNILVTSSMKLLQFFSKE